MFNQLIRLLDIKKDKDEGGDTVEITIHEHEVLAEIRTLYERERTQAAASGLRPERKFAIADYYDYDNQHYLEHEGIRYTIIEALRKYESNEIEILATSIVNQGGIAHGGPQ